MTSTIDSENNLVVLTNSISSSHSITEDYTSATAASSSPISSSMSNTVSDSQKSNATIAATAAPTTTTSTTPPKANVNNISTMSTNQSLSSSASSSSSFSASATKRTTSTNDIGLKTTIIEFMRERPFLWNNKHPNFRDHKRREQEYQQFSKEINYPVQEIKRVWHVLRTNFFRAHKILLDRPHNSSNGHNSSNSDKLWKYYLSMEYLLEGTKVDFSARANHSANTTATNNKINNTSVNNIGNFSNNSNNNIDNSSNIKLEMTDDSSSSKETTATPTFNESVAAMEIDDDHLYARSLTATLKRFDPTTKEVIKLKFQKIIVDHMQKSSLSISHKSNKVS